MYTTAAESTIYFRLLVSSLLLVFVLPLRTSKIINDLLRSLFFSSCVYLNHMGYKKEQVKAHVQIESYQIKKGASSCHMNEIEIRKAHQSIVILF